MKRILTVVIGGLLPFGALFAQTPTTNFNTQSNWSLHKKELRIGFGATQFNGDLGGNVGVGRNYSLYDLDWPATGVGGTLGFRYRFAPMFATTSSLNFFSLKADDQFSEEVIRNSRNLRFSSFNIELSQRMDLILFSREKFGSLYNLPGNYTLKSLASQYYLFAGIGIMYFNPKAEYNGTTYALRKLRTEGQEKAYSPITGTMSFGYGMRWSVSRMWRVGVEVSYSKTFSDYIDDVSTTYATAAQLGNDPIRMGLANMAPGNPSFAPGQQRGNSSQKDAFYNINVVVTRNITYKDYGRQRNRQTLKSAGRFKV